MNAALAHHAYWNPVLEDNFCAACGDNWPCLPWREANPACKCSHAKSQHSRGEGQCWLGACGCRFYREKAAA